MYTKQKIVIPQKIGEIRGMEHTVCSIHLLSLQANDQTREREETNAIIFHNTKTSITPSYSKTTDGQAHCQASVLHARALSLRFRFFYFLYFWKFFNFPYSIFQTTNSVSFVISFYSKLSIFFSYSPFSFLLHLLASVVFLHCCDWYLIIFFFGNSNLSFILYCSCFI